MTYKNLLHTQKQAASRMSLCFSWYIPSFHSRPTTPSFALPRTPPSSSSLLLLLLPPLYLQDPSSLFLPCWLTSPTPQGMSHIGFPDVSGSTTCPAFSNELQPLWALGEFACCDWHLLGRTVWLWNRMKFRPILQQSNDRVRLNAWVKLQHIMQL